MTIAGPPRWENGPSDGPTFLFAHGAGAPADSAFMANMAAALGNHGIHVVRFEFPYMAQRRVTGKNRAPDRAAVLSESWLAEIAAAAAPLVVGGKSMGGRYASMAAAEVPVAGVVCFGYPFHAPGKPDAPRIAHLFELTCPALIFQGTNDPFGAADDVAAYGLPESLTFHWFEGSGHDLAPGRGSGPAAARNHALAAELAAAFIRSVAT